MSLKSLFISVNQFKNVTLVLHRFITLSNMFFKYLTIMLTAFRQKKQQISFLSNLDKILIKKQDPFV